MSVNQPAVSDLLKAQMQQSGQQAGQLLSRAGQGIQSGLDKAQSWAPYREGISASQIATGIERFKAFILVSMSLLFVAYFIGIGILMQVLSKTDNIYGKWTKTVVPGDEEKKTAGSTTWGFDSAAYVGERCFLNSKMTKSALKKLLQFLLATQIIIFILSMVVLIFTFDANKIRKNLFIIATVIIFLVGFGPQLGLLLKMKDVVVASDASSIYAGQDVSLSSLSYNRESSTFTDTAGTFTPYGLDRYTCVPFKDETESKNYYNLSITNSIFMTVQLVMVGYYSYWWFKF